MFDNKSIADILLIIATYMELIEENTFKIRAFQNAARTIETLPRSIAAMIDDGAPLTGIKGIGKALAPIIEEIAREGYSSELDRLKEQIPEGIPELLEIQGMGPKKVITVWRELGITTIGELEYACRENHLVELPGFGEKSQQKILRAIEFRKQARGSFLYPDALAIAGSIIDECAKSGLFEKVTLAGSLRRGKKFVKDADILVVPGNDIMPDTIRDFLAGLADGDDEEKEITGAGTTKVSIRIKGLQVDFRVIGIESYPAGLQYFTGSKEHNTLLRSRAKSRGYKLNEYGLYSGDDRLPCATEEELYRSLGCVWIPPEIREAQGEIVAAEENRLPVPVTRTDIRGMIHVHSMYSDGRNTLLELAKASIDLGYGYLCISDHSQSARYAGGLVREKLEAQRNDIARLNGELSPFRIFSGIESDIHTTGALDYDDDVLASFDFVIGSIHSKLTMGRDEAIERLCAAISNPHITILGHVSGRLLLSREGYPYDEEKVLDRLVACGVVLEHNCNPYRLDPDWEMLKRAGERGILVSLDPDAHTVEGFEHIAYGVVMARKAWLVRHQILNCKTAEELDDFFRERKKRKGA